MNKLLAYEVTVQGFPPILYSARSPAKARSRSYRDYCSYDNQCTFSDFLKISTLRRAPYADNQHERVLICGKPATIIIHPYRRDLFMYDDSDDVLSAHETEIERPHPRNPHPMNDKLERAILSIDGNCGCALLGENLQEGEAEFVEVEQRPGEALHDAEIRAAHRALAQLGRRLNKSLTYAWYPRKPGSAGA